MEKKLILICDDDPVVHESLDIYFEADGYETHHTYDGEQGLKKALETDYSIIILDLMMPRLGGIDVCRELRKTKSTPVIMLSAKGEEIDKILGLELGADDYIVKPFSPREVVARTKAILRRVNQYSENTQDTGIVEFPGLIINISRYSVEVDGATVPFTPKEVELLYMLASNPGRVFTREKILEQIWGYEYFGDTRTVDTHIKRIRGKLPMEDAKYGLHTIYGVGYKFEENS
ncbi:MAG: response regulator transcription factor [Clostridia bacterium]|nr:response regulator transcription factor [Clostridia bacterium]